MGESGEYDPSFLDSVLVHAALIPIIGAQLQGYLDNLACPMGSDSLLSLCTLPFNRLSGFGENMIKSMLVYHKDREFPQRADMIAILRDMHAHLTKKAQKQGYETLKELVLRLVERLAEVIPWNENWNQQLLFSGYDRAPRSHYGPGKDLLFRFRPMGEPMELGALSESSG